jgi:hypothetical protein
MMVIGESSMAADALEVRIAHLEGAYEQIDKRLGSLDGRMASLERTVNERTDRVEQKLDATFRWVIGILLVYRCRNIASMRVIQLNRSASCRLSATTFSYMESTQFSSDFLPFEAS